MRVRIMKRGDGAFDILTEPGRKSGLPKKLFQGVKKEDIESVVTAPLEAADAERAARRQVREGSQTP